MAMKLVIYVAQLRAMSNEFKIVGGEPERGKMCLDKGVEVKGVEFLIGFIWLWV
jgi:hypothetical protein